MWQRIQIEGLWTQRLLTCNALTKACQIGQLVMMSIADPLSPVTIDSVNHETSAKINNPMFMLLFFKSSSFLFSPSSDFVILSLESWKCNVRCKKESMLDKSTTVAVQTCVLYKHDNWLNKPTSMWPETEKLNWRFFLPLSKHLKNLGVLYKNNDKCTETRH